MLVWLDRRPYKADGVENMLSGGNMSPQGYNRVGVQFMASATDYLKDVFCRLKEETPHPKLLTPWSWNGLSDGSNMAPCKQRMAFPPLYFYKSHLALTREDKESLKHHLEVN